MIRIRSATGATQFDIDVTPAGRIRVKTAYNGTVLAESADGVITFGAYQFLEVQFTCTGTDSIQVWVDGTEVIALTTGINLRQSGAGGFGQLLLGPYSSSISAFTDWDDLYILDSSGDAPFNDRLGDQKMDGHLFTSDGSVLQWTSNKASHYDAINDRGSTYATYYNESDAEGECDCYGITPNDMTTILAVTIRAYCRNPGGGTAKFRPFVKFGEGSGDVYFGDEVTLPADTCDLREYTWYENPQTTAAWTKTQLQSVEFGWECTELS